MTIANRQMREAHIEIVKRYADRYGLMQPHRQRLVRIANGEESGSKRYHTLAVYARLLQTYERILPVKRMFTRSEWHSIEAMLVYGTTTKQSHTHRKAYQKMIVILELADSGFLQLKRD